jgi:hypothetical protein
MESTVSDKQPDERQQYIFVLKIGVVIYALSFGIFLLIEPDDFFYNKLKIMLFFMVAVLIFTVARIIQLSRGKNGR